MAHVATATIQLSTNKNGPSVATNRATELRIQKLRHDSFSKQLNSGNVKRQYSFNPQAKTINGNLRSRVEIFENNNENYKKEIIINNHKASTPKTTTIRPPDIIELKNKENKDTTNRIKVEKKISIVQKGSAVNQINEPETKTIATLRNVTTNLPTNKEPKNVGAKTERKEPEIITIATLNVATSLSKNKEQKNESVWGEKKLQRYQTVDVPIRTPALNITVSSWAGNKQFVTTDEGHEEVKRILNERRKKIDESLEKEEKSKKGETKVELRPISMNAIDDTLRESVGDCLEVSYPKAIDLARHQQRPLWRDIKGIQEAGILETLTKEGRVRQEAKFEMMLSEGTFLHSLNILTHHYMNNIKKHIPQVISEKDYDTLFKNVLDLHSCSQAFLQDMDDMWQDDPLLNGIYQIIKHHASENFGAYKKYCRNMLDMSKHLTELITNNESFRNLLEVLINREGSQRLTLDSFLTAPMQRITKLPLLMKTILDKTEEGTEEHALCIAAYEATAKIAGECDEVVTEKKRLEELLRLSQEIDFADDTKSIPILAPNRSLISRANVRHFAFRDKATKREKLQLILFSDLLLVTKRKSEKHFSVVDHCSKDRVFLKEVGNTTLYGQVESSNQLKPVVITLLSNSQDKKVDLVLTFKDQNQCKEWLHILAVPEEEDETEQVIAIQEHIADSSDELNLSPGDVIKVTSPENEGWCEGEIVIDGTKGRFPLAKTTKIISPRAKAAKIKAKKELRLSKNSEESPTKSDNESSSKETTTEPSKDTKTETDTQTILTEDEIPNLETV